MAPLTPPSSASPHSAQTHDFMAKGSIVIDSTGCKPALTVTPLGFNDEEWESEDHKSEYCKRRKVH